MKILITGGNGFLGTALAKKLVERGYLVRSLSRSGRASGDAVPGVEYCSGDILDPASLEGPLQDCQGIFHAAGMISYDPRKALEMQRINVEGTRNIVEAALRAGVKRFIHTSSTAAIGVNYNPQQELHEDSEFNAAHLGMAYFDTKFAAEAELRRLAKGRMEFVIVNPGSIIGAGDTRRYEQVYAGLIQKYNPRVLPPGGNNFVTLRNVVDGHLAAWDLGKSGERYILGGENLSFAALIERVNRILDRPSPKIRLPVFSMQFVALLLWMLRLCGVKLHITPALVRQVGSWYLFVSSAKAQRDLNYRPEKIDDALSETLSWLRSLGRIK